MALNNASADALAASICTALGVSSPSVTATKYQQVYRLIYAALKTDITATITALSINTAGSATNQSGPPSPVPVVIS